MRFPAIASDWSAFSDTTVLVEARTQTGTNAIGEPTFTVVTVYDGVANVFEATGGIRISALAEMVQREVHVVIDLAPGAVPPTIPVGARVTLAADPDGLVHRLLVRSVQTYCLDPASVVLVCEANQSW